MAFTLLANRQPPPSAGVTATTAAAVLSGIYLLRLSATFSVLSIVIYLIILAFHDVLISGYCRAMSLLLRISLCLRFIILIFYLLIYLYLLLATYVLLIDIIFELVFINFC